MCAASEDTNNSGEVDENLVYIGRGVPISNEKCLKIVELALAKPRISQHEISRQVGVSQCSVSNILSRYTKETGCIIPDAKAKHIKSKVTPKVKSYIRQVKEGDPGITASKIRDKLLENRICDASNLPSVNYICKIIANKTEPGNSDQNLQQFERLHSNFPLENEIQTQQYASIVNNQNTTEIPRPSVQPVSNVLGHLQSQSFFTEQPFSSPGVAISQNKNNMCPHLYGYNHFNQNHEHWQQTHPYFLQENQQQSAHIPLSSRENNLLYPGQRPSADSLTNVLGHFQHSYSFSGRSSSADDANLQNYRNYTGPPFHRHPSFH